MIILLLLASINAIAKPAMAASPILLPPSSNASGIIDSANITRIAPAANDIATDITKGLALDKTAKPIAVDMFLLSQLYKIIRLYTFFYFFHLISYRNVNNF